MFTKIIFLYVVVVCVCGAPPTNVVPLEKQQPIIIAIVAQSEELEPNGTFKFSYETANGIKREETSYDKVLPKGKSSASSNEGGEDKDDESNEIHVQRGSYSYTAPDGSVISVSYIADENGFRPIGDHLPKAPTARASKNKAGDNEESGSEPAAAIVEPSVEDSSKSAQKKTDSIKIESRIADQSSEQVSTVKPEDLSNTPEGPSTNQEESSTAQEESYTTTEIPSTTTDQSSTTQTESSTTTEIPSLTTDQSSTTQAESSTTTEIPSITADQSTTTQAESSTTTEIPSITTDQSSTTQEESSTSTEIPSTTPEVSSTPKISSTSEAASTESASPSTSAVTSSEVTSTEAASTSEKASSKATSSEETTTPTATNNDALPDSTPNSDATTDASTPV